LLPVHAADAAGPIRVLMVGDSLPVTLDFGLGPAGPSFGIDLESDAVIGCGLVVVGLVTNLGTTAPETGGLRDSQLIQCSTWPRRWRNDETTFHPDVSVLLDGVWEVRDREIDGHWTHIGEPAFDRQELAALNRAVDVLGSTGSKVVLLTCPYLSQPEQADGQPWPDDNPARVNTYNRLLDKVAAEHRGVEVIDLGAYVSPGGRYSPVVDGIDVRDPDGLHFSLAGGKFVAPWLLPQLYSVGVAHRSETQPLTADPLAGPSPDPYPGS
jgi:hypothetical protein